MLATRRSPPPRTKSRDREFGGRRGPGAAAPVAGPHEFKWIRRNQYLPAGSGVGAEALFISFLLFSAPRGAPPLLTVPLRIGRRPVGVHPAHNWQATVRSSGPFKSLGIKSSLAAVSAYFAPSSAGCTGRFWHGSARLGGVDLDERPIPLHRKLFSRPVALLAIVYFPKAAGRSSGSTECARLGASSYAFASETAAHVWAQRFLRRGPEESLLACAA